MSILSANLVWFGLYLPDTRNHVGNLKIEQGSVLTWQYVPNPKNTLNANHPFCFMHGGYVSIRGEDYCLNENLGASFGVINGFALQGFDDELRYHLVTNTFGSFDCFIIPASKYSHFKTPERIAFTRLMVNV